MTLYVEPSESVAGLVNGILDDMGPYRRVIVAGGPRVGKSTLSELAAKRAGVPAQHTDDTIQLGWSNASAEVANWFDRPGPWVIEGVAIPRALRKWFAQNPTGKPCDVIYWSNLNKVPRSLGQEAMAKGCETVWRAVIREVMDREIPIKRF